MKREWMTLWMIVTLVSLAAGGVSKALPLAGVVQGEDAAQEKKGSPATAPAKTQMVPPHYGVVDPSKHRKAPRSVGWAKNPLTVAAYEGDIERVRVLLKQKDLDVNSEIGGWSAMEAAAHGGYTEIVKLLIDAGADVKGRLGRKAIKYTILGGHKETARLLIKEGVEVKGEAKKDLVPLTIRNGHPEMLPILFEADKTP